MFYLYIENPEFINSLFTITIELDKVSQSLKFLIHMVLVMEILCFNDGLKYYVLLLSLPRICRSRLLKN